MLSGSSLIVPFSNFKSSLDKYIHILNVATYIYKTIILFYLASVDKIHCSIALSNSSDVILYSLATSLNDLTVKLLFEFGVLLLVLL